MTHRISPLIVLLVLVIQSVCTSFAQEEEPQVYEPPRDFGTDWRPSVLLGLTPEDGVLIGGGPILYKFGFRRMPYVFRMQLVGGVALKTGAFKFEYTALYPAISVRLSLELLGRASELEVRNFYGFGNGSKRIDSFDGAKFYRVSLREYQFRPVLRYRIADGVKIGLGAFIKHVEVRQKDHRYLTADSLAALGDDRSFLGSVASLEADMRNRPSATTSGWYISTEAGSFPYPFRRQAPFHKIAGDVRLYLTHPSIPNVTLALRVGGKKVYGDFPFYEAAFLGGFGSLRGFNTERFAGDAAAFGNADLRVSLFRMKLLVPTTVGVFGLTDVGRVWLNKGSPESWHVGAGGGISLAPLSADNTISLAFAHSKDGLFLLGGFGFGF